ncbi:enoyl-CoA hydratase/isomerase family protein [Gilvimarinus agarilyticus]|uniref:enoyl-CoA hydratase/isomerase family protein n=1 Tax=Gilvimarinus sp. 2_MG-2023 TaxID=3062666 RepID=UPI001C083B24|nr:enoyl-CoA hydratase-related protein [Gilvimarinus sp. 2_MG-2023]MBU2887732.1 enoyl-CoA hydratase/isomerase family protein [Gilvimarinus agarilyticus]MDO6572379.1 enoyl-CoA hydratase-related protein [Gilvimarinus sp. 2_MG-2023]
MITLNKNGRVLELTFNRPPANAYTLEFMQALAQKLDEIDAEQEASVVLLTSASDKFFCAGADIKAFAQNTTEQNHQLVAQARANTAQMEASDKLFIACIGGHVLGGGLELAMACDLRFAAHGGYLWGLPEIKLGLIPGNGGSQRLARLVGMSKALELLATGDTFSTQEAFEFGLVSRLMDTDELLPQAREYAQRVAKGPALALAATKHAVRGGVQMSLEDGLALEKKLCDTLYDTEDAAEGFNAFIEKRDAIFTGR